MEDTTLKTTLTITNDFKQRCINDCSMFCKCTFCKHRIPSIIYKNKTAHCFACEIGNYCKTCNLTSAEKKGQ